MKEEVFIHDGRGVIYIKGSPSDTLLFIKKQPRIASFFAEVGTVWRYQIGREIDEDLIRENYQYEHLVKSGTVNSDESLSKQFNHITQLLTNGRYELQLCECSWELYILPAINKTNEIPYYDSYGGLSDITATQTYLDQNIVEEYKHVIKNGKKPIVVLLKIKDSWAIFILDGHHKLQAYKALQVNPKVLLISKLDSKVTNQEEGIKTMKMLGMNQEKWFEIYQEEKTTKNFERNYYKYYAEGLDLEFK